MHLSMGTIRLQLFIEQAKCPNKDIVIYLNDETQEIRVSNDEDAFETDFFVFMEGVIRHLQGQGSIRTAENYITALNCLRKYHDGITLPMNMVDSNFVCNFERSLKRRGVCLNTSSFYLRIIRAVYNRAVRQGIAKDCHPFSLVYTSVGKTEKRAVDIETIKLIGELACRRKNECLARDLFMFSFYTRGMSFVDIAFLKKQDIRNGYVYYRRHKTGQLLVVKWERQMEEIVALYPTEPENPYLLPIIKHPGEREMQQYRYKLCTVNNELKTIGQRVGLDNGLTMYVARHSWATIAKSLNTPVEVISEAMGHTNEKTTHIYLKSINANQIDTVNSKIINLITRAGEAPGLIKRRT